MDRKPMLVFDVESVGLFGDPFAVGSVLIGPDGSTLAKDGNKIPLANAQGTDEDRAWVRQNVSDEWIHTTTEDCRVRGLVCLVPDDLCRVVVDGWVEMAISNGFRIDDVLVFADIGWPVEHRFLERCRNVIPGYGGPYPLLDVGSVLWTAGYDPTGTYRRHRAHYPAHDPIKDAEHSARLLVSALKEVDAAIELRNAMGKAIVSVAGLVPVGKESSP